MIYASSQQTLTVNWPTLLSENRLDVESAKQPSPYVTAGPGIDTIRPSSGRTVVDSGLSVAEQTLSVPSASPALFFVLQRQPAVLSRAERIAEQYGDPVQNLSSLLGTFAGTDEEWEDFVDRP